MRELGRIWTALAALGAGLVHLGAAARLPAALLAAFALLGAAEVIWAVAALARRRAALPRIALAVAVAAPLAWGAASLTGVAGLPAGALAGASLLDLVAALLIAGRRRVRGARAPRVATYLVGLAAGAAVVAAVAAASLAAGVPQGGGMAGMGM